MVVDLGDEENDVLGDKCRDGDDDWGANGNLYLFTQVTFTLSKCVSSEFTIHLCQVTGQYFSTNQWPGNFVRGKYFTRTASLTITLKHST